MNLRKVIYPPVAKFVYSNYKTASANIISLQHQQLMKLLKQAQDTEFGKQYQFKKIKNYDDYRKIVPLHFYNDLKSSIERMAFGEENILWPKSPAFFACTSGTSGGQKFIPISQQGLKSQKMGRLITMANYSIKYNKLNQLKGPLLFFSARPSFVKFGKYQAQLVSSLMTQTIPNWLKQYNLPSNDVQSIPSFDLRIKAMLQEALVQKNMLRGIVAFPPWLHLFLNELQSQTNHSFKEIFPNFSLLVTSGMSYQPYEQIVQNIMGNGFDQLETYPSSEGFISFKETLLEDGMSLLPNNGLFYEFVKLNELYNENPNRICIDAVENNIEYAIVLTTNSGLWSYVLGDTIKFISTDPIRMIITGRVGKTLSLAAEHVNNADVDSSIAKACSDYKIILSEYMVSGSFDKQLGKPFYEWLIEADPIPNDIIDFGKSLDEQLKKHNVLYEELSEDGVMQASKVNFINKGSFMKYYAQQGIDAQQKVEHITQNYDRFCEIKNTILNVNIS